jgi:hypothetical protein
MKKIILLVFTILLSNLCEAQVFAKRKANKDTEKWRYEVSCVDYASSTNVVIKVFSFSKKPKVAIEQAKKNAIHAVIFQGINTGNCGTKNALITNPNTKDEKQEYFKDFFATGGKYMKFVTASNNGRVKPGDVSKISKKEYKIGVIVSVDRQALKKELEAAGILENIGNIFK